MNKYGKLIVALFIFTLGVGISNSSIKTELHENNLGINGLEVAPSMNVSEYIEFTGPPIVLKSEELLNPYRVNIDNANANYSWDKWKSEYAWCSGSGTVDNPYVIENLYINCKGNGGGIYILNSNVSFIIRNCWVNYTGPDELDDGVLVCESMNGIIKDNLFTYTHVGVWVEFSCSLITVSNNFILGDHTTAGKSIGLHLGYMCKNVMYNDNKIINCYEGILGHKFENSTFKGNYIRNTLFPKDEIREPVRFNMISESKIIYNKFEGDAYANAKEFVLITNSLNNTIFNNTVVVNTTSSPSASINTPKFQNGGSSDTGIISLDRCHHNYIAHNMLYVSRSGVNIPGYDIFMILGVLSIISVIIVRKILKK